MGGKTPIFAKWFAVGLGLKRWLIMLVIGIILIAVSLSFAITELRLLEQLIANSSWITVGISALIGLILIFFALSRMSVNLLAPYRLNQQGHVVDVMYAHTRRSKGLKVVAIGGGTGLPSVLRGLKPYTNNITAVVTVADDGGSSGRLRRDLGVLPPGDLRNNIVALSDDENAMTRLFQYRFKNGELDGHAFGNLFISALAGITGSLETALIETARVLNMQGRVLPATLEEVNLAADVQLDPDHPTRHIVGESSISDAGGRIEHIYLLPDNAPAYDGSVQAILEADIVILGPGSLYTSILPNLLVKGIAEALRATSAYKIYACNVATQPGETDGYTVADHVLALEKHIGRGVFQVVVANDYYPQANANTHYVQPAPTHHEIFQRYDVRYTDLTDNERPWRHDPRKLAAAILHISGEERIAGASPKTIFTDKHKPVKLSNT